MNTNTDITNKLNPAYYNTIYYGYIPHRIPYKCPICSGSGLVPRGFYSIGECYTSTDATPEQCRSCNGSGIVWSY